MNIDSNSNTFSAGGATDRKKLPIKLKMNKQAINQQQSLPAHKDHTKSRIIHENIIKKGNDSIQGSASHTLQKQSKEGITDKNTITSRLQNQSKIINQTINKSMLQSPQQMNNNLPLQQDFINKQSFNRKGAGNGFISNSQRFQYSIYPNTGPGPGSYLSNKTNEQAPSNLNQQISITPSNSNSVRDSASFVSNGKNIINNSRLQQQYHQIPARKKHILKPIQTEYKTPGPGQYFVNEEQVIKRAPNYHSVFKSSSNRILNLEKTLLDTTDKGDKSPIEIGQSSSNRQLAKEDSTDEIILPKKSLNKLNRNSNPNIGNNSIAINKTFGLANNSNPLVHQIYMGTEINKFNLIKSVQSMDEIQKLEITPQSLTPNIGISHNSQQSPLKGNGLKVISKLNQKQEQKQDLFFTANYKIPRIHSINV